MNTITLTIRLGNDAMNTPEDVAQLLHDAADHISEGYYPKYLFDINGNRVGEFTYNNN